MTATLSTQIELDAKGVARIAGTRWKVKHIVVDMLHHKMSPAEMVRQYAHLSLAQIHCALTYYYENQASVDAQIEESNRLARELAAAQQNSTNPLLTRLRALNQANSSL